jgi:hypothetical protein
MTSPAHDFAGLLASHEEDIYDAMEDAIEKAFRAGWERAQHFGQQEAPEYGYVDWRGFGPGHTLPGGQRYRNRLPGYQEEGIR